MCSVWGPLNWYTELDIHYITLSRSNLDINENWERSQNTMRSVLLTRDANILFEEN